MPLAAAASVCVMSCLFSNSASTPGCGRIFLLGMLHFQGLGGRHMADVFEEKLAEFMSIIVELYRDFSEKPGEF